MQAMSTPTDEILCNCIPDSTYLSISLYSLLLNFSSEEKAYLFLYVSLAISKLHVDGQYQYIYIYHCSVSALGYYPLPHLSLSLSYLSRDYPHMQYTHTSLRSHCISGCLGPHTLLRISLYALEENSQPKFTCNHFIHRNTFLLTSTRAQWCSHCFLSLPYPSCA